MTTTYSGHGQIFGVSAKYPYGDSDRAARSWDRCYDQMARHMRSYGYLWVRSRIKVTTGEADGPEYLVPDDEAWEQVTYTFTPTIVDRAAAPVVRAARWGISIAHASIMYCPALIRAAQGGNRAATLVLDVVARHRDSPNLHTTREITKRLGAHPYDWMNRRR